MFTDPQTVTVDSVAQVLPTISREKSKSTYREDVGEYSLEISHQETGKRNRRVVRLNRSKVTSDPFIPANNVTVSHFVYLVMDHPVAGFTMDELDKDVAGLVAWLSSANVQKVLGGES